MALLVGLVAFGVYAWITPVVSGLGDGPEFTVGLAHAGLVHPTGYPLYILAGYPFVQAVHAMGATWAWAANAWSGVGAAVAVTLCFLTAKHIASTPNDDGGLRPAGSRAAAILAGLAPAALLAVNPVLLREAVEAEVNTWALAWTMGLALLFVKRLGGNGRAPGESAARHGFAWGLLCGAGAAHHLTSVLVSVPLSAALAALLARRGQLNVRLVATAAVGAVLPLVAYGFVAWRAGHPAPGQWLDIAPTAGSVLDHVTGRRYRTFLGYFDPDPVSRGLLGSGVYPFLFPGLLLLGVAGARAAALQGRVLHGGLFVAALATLLFTLNYGVPDPAPYLLPATGIALLGLAPLGPALAARGRAGGGAGLLVAIVLVAALAWTGFRDARARRDGAERFDREIRTVWDLVPRRPGLLFWNTDQVNRLIEYQTLRNERPALWIASPEWLLDPPVRALVRRRFGMDPIEGMEIPYAPISAPWSEAVRRNFFDAALARLSAGTGLPVYWFDPARARVLVVRNPEAPPARRESGSP